MLHAAARMTATVPVECPEAPRPARVDRYQISTSFPFGFIKRAVERQHKDTSLIYPRAGAVSIRNC